MAFLDDVMLWEFRGTEFAAKLAQPSEWDQWFDEVVISTTEPILDSNDLHTDIGGKSYGDLSLRATFETPEDRAEFAAMMSTSGTLSGPSGETRTALLARIKKIGSGTNAYSLLDVTFRAV